MENKAQQFASFHILQTLLMLFSNSREPSRGIAKRTDEWEKKVSEGLQELNEKQNKIMVFHGIDELKKGEKIPNEAVTEINNLYNSESSLSIEDTRFLSEKEYEACFPFEESVIKRGDRKMLEFWVVVEEKEG